MQASLLAVLNESERLLVAETESAALAQLDEDAVGELHGRIRRARNKYIGQYRRGCERPGRRQGWSRRSAAGEPHGGAEGGGVRGGPVAVSRKLAAQGSHLLAAELKAERLAAAAAAKQGAKPAAGKGPLRSRRLGAPYPESRVAIAPCVPPRPRRRARAPARQATGGRPKRDSARYCGSAW